MTVLGKRRKNSMDKTFQSMAHNISLKPNRLIYKINYRNLRCKRKRKKSNAFLYNATLYESQEKDNPGETSKM
jgi:hypothetical protein